MKKALFLIVALLGLVAILHRTDVPKGLTAGGIRPGMPMARVRELNPAGIQVSARDGQFVSRVQAKQLEFNGKSLVAPSLEATRALLTESLGPPDSVGTDAIFYYEVDGCELSLTFDNDRFVELTLTRAGRQ